MSEWFKKPTHQAGLLVAVGFVATALIAVLGDHAEWPVLLLLTLLAGVFQVAGAVLLNRTGKADPTLARASVRRLLALAVRAREAKLVAEAAYEQGSAADSKKLMGKLSSEMSYLEESAVQAIEDWREFHKDALADIDDKERSK